MDKHYKVQINQAIFGRYFFQRGYRPMYKTCLPGGTFTSSVDGIWLSRGGRLLMGEHHVTA